MPSFNAYGPKCVPMEALQQYQQLQPQNGKDWTIDELFCYAIDESHPTTLRILAWRDLLFQNGGSSSSPKTIRCCHNTYAHYSNLLNVGGGSEEGAALRRAFRGRPKLIREFSSQLYYNLQHHLMLRQDFSNCFTDPCDSFIELLLPITSKTMARALWNHHSCSCVIRSKYRFETFHKWLDLCLPQANMPQWLVNTLWKDFTNLATSESKFLKQSTNFIPFDDIQDHCLTLFALIDHLHCLNFEKQANLVTKYLQQLERLLPCNYLYLDFFDLRQIAPILTDIQTTCQVLVRHLNPIYSKVPPANLPSRYLKDTENFFCWAAGFAKLARQNRPEAYAEQNNLLHIISTIHEEAKASGTIRIY